MAVINAVNEVLHRIRVKLYPNCLTHVEGAYIARTDNEASLSIGEVCAALKNRGGFTGSYDDLVEHVKQFFDEAAYRLCDGFAVNTGCFSVHPNVGGTFDKVTEGHDTEKHPVTFRFRTRAPLRALAERIVVEVEGLADAAGYIDEFIDITTESVNDALTPGGQFSVSGHKIKAAGEDAGVGVYFVSADDPALEAGKWKAEIRTRFNGSGSSTLKSLRTITGAFTLTVPAPAPCPRPDQGV
jgi:hypothetical protein